MSAQDHMRAMLAQLMGTARDGDLTKSSIRFDDSRVCKSFLLGCCPHDLLASTRMDLGECSKVHDVALRADYEAAAKNKDYYYDIDAMEHLESFLIDCDIKTEQAKRRLKETQEELCEESAAKEAVINGFGEQIGITLAKAEAVGAAGDVDESLRLLQEVEELKKNKLAAEMDYHNTMPASNYQQQKLRVCEICCAFLGIHDNDRRLADHFGGKLHVGFITLRQKLVELKVTVEERKVQRQKERDERRLELDRKTSPIERSRSSDRKRRSKSSDRKRRSRSSDRRKRSRSSDRKRRSRSSDRRRRSRERRSRSSRERRRSRSADRKRRSRSKHRSRSHKRSRSRDGRKRSRSRSHRRRSRSKESKSRRSRDSSRHHSRSMSSKKENVRLSGGSAADSTSKKSSSNSPDTTLVTGEAQI